MGKTKRGKGPKLMAVADGSGLLGRPRGVWLRHMKSPLSRETLASTFTTQLSQRLIGDKAYTNGPLDKALARQGIEMNGPAPKPSEEAPDPRRQTACGVTAAARRVERLFAWLQNFRRVVVRYERHIENFLGFVHLACILILLRCYL